MDVLNLEGPVKTFLAPRGHGKTRKVMQWAVSKLYNEQDFVVVCMDGKEATRLYEALARFGAEPKHFTAATLDLEKRLSGFIHPVAIDNIDLLANTTAHNLIKRLNVEIVTATADWLPEGRFI